jgi:hypothetical protein
MSEAIARTPLAGRLASDAARRLRPAGRHAVAAGAVAGVSVVGGAAVANGAFLPLLALAVLTLYVVFFVARPAMALLAFAGTQPLVAPWIQLQAGGTSLGELWGAGLLASVLAYLAVSLRPARAVEPRYTVPLVFLVAYPALTLWRPDATFAAISTVKAASWILLAVAVERIAGTAAGQRWVLRAGCFMATLSLAAVGAAIVQNQYGAAYYYENAFVGEGQTPHGYVALVVLVLPFLLLALLRGRHVLAASVLVAALCIEVIVSYVRTGYLALGVLIVGCAALGVHRRRTSVLVSALVGAVAIVVAAVVLGDTVSARLNDLSNLTQPGGIADNAGAGRLGFWSAVTQASYDSAGLLAYGGGALSSEAITTRVLGDNFWAHNDFLEMLATGGLTLLLCYVALVAWLYRSFWVLARDRRQSRAARDVGTIGLLATGAFTVVATFNGVVTTPVAAFALLLGLGRGMCATPGTTFLDGDRPRRAPADGTASRG